MGIDARSIRVTEAMHIRDRRYGWRLFCAFGAIAMIVVVSPARVVAQAGPGGVCGKIMPSEVVGDWAFASGATGAFAVVPPTFNAPVAAAGAATATVGTAGTIAASAASVLAGVELGCRLAELPGAQAVFDVLLGDAADVGDPAMGMGAGTVALADPVECTAYSSWSSTFSNTIGGFWGTSSHYQCRLVTLASPPPATSYWVSNRSGSVNDSFVTIPARTIADNFVQSPQDGVGDDCIPGCSNVSRPRFWSPGMTTTGNCGPNNTGSSCRWTNLSAREAIIAYPCDGDIGGSCGVPPGTVFALRSLSGSPFYAILSAWPEAHSLGWQRRLVTEVRCLDVGTSTERWERFIGEPYWDAAPDQRIVIPQCEDSEAVTGYRVSRVPVGVTCSGPSNGASCAQKWRVEEAIAPSTWLSDAPDWITCLSADVDCGAPALDLDTMTCTWGGFSIGGDACDPAQQAGPDATVSTLRPQPAGAVHVVGDLVPTTGSVLSTASPMLVEEPPPPGDGGAVVPIEPGGGPRAPGFVPDEDEAECWPDGWGWLNPVEWVLKPIKCALVWAFVPSDEALTDFVGDHFDPLGEEFPFSVLLSGVDFVSSFVVAMQQADPEACFASEIPIGDDDATFCLDGEALPFTLTGEARLFAVLALTIPLYLAVMRDAWTLVRSA